MAAIRKELIGAAINRAFALTDYNIQNNFEKQHEFRSQIILADESLTKDEKSEAIKKSNKNFDLLKILYNEGTKRICENCQEQCLATSRDTQFDLTFDIRFEFDSNLQIQISFFLI